MLLQRKVDTCSRLIAPSRTSYVASPILSPRTDGGWGRFGSPRAASDRYTGAACFFTLLTLHKLRLVINCIHLVATYRGVCCLLILFVLRSRGLIHRRDGR